MAKRITKKIKLQIQAAKATPAPPLGPALGQAGINIGDFVTKFNAATAKMAGDKVSVLISVYEDRSYDFIVKTPPVTGLILKAAGVENCNGQKNTVAVTPLMANRSTQTGPNSFPTINYPEVRILM